MSSPQPAEKEGTGGSKVGFRGRHAHCDTALGPGAGNKTNVGTLERGLSVIGGAALTLYGLGRGKLSGLAWTALGGGLLYRGLTGRCNCYRALGIDTAHRNPAIGVPARKGYRLEKSVTINRPAHEVYSRWRDVEKLPQFMAHLKSVRRLDEQRSHWVARGVFGRDPEWDAEIINDRENELIAWRSLPGGDIDTAGSVHFRELAPDRGTEVAVSLKYNPLGGKVGAQIASWFGEGLEKKLEQDLHNFKQVMETGEIATTDEQPVGPS